MDTVLIYKDTNKLLGDGRIFKGGYEPPKDHDWEEEKKLKGIEEIPVEYIEEKPKVSDERTQKVIKGSEVVNGVYKVGYLVVDKTQEEIDKYDLKQPKKTDKVIDELYEYLKNTPATKDNIIEQIEKLKEYNGIK